MAAPTDVVLADTRFLRLVLCRRARGLPDRLSQSDKIIIRRGRGAEVAVVAHEFPPPRSRQPNRVVLTQVVGMWLGKGRQRADDRRRLSVDIGQRRDRRPMAAVTRASTW